MSDNGVAFLASRGRGAGNVLATLDMLGRQAPSPDAAPVAPPPDMPANAKNPTTAPLVAYRVVISYGRGDDTYVVALEVWPDWELGGTWNVSGQTATGIAQVISAMLGPKGLKDYTGEFTNALGPEAVSPDATAAATDPRSARGQPAGRATNAGRGRKNRPADPVVDLGRAADGPGSGEPGEAVVRRAEASVPQAQQPGG